MQFPSFVMLISSACQKGKLPLCFQAFFASIQLQTFIDTTPLEVLVELLLLTRNPSLLVFEDIWQSKLSQNVDRR